MAERDATSAQTAPATVMIVEDDAALASELMRLLELQGMKASLCGDFQHAAESIVAAKPDCLVLDLKLPGTDGLQICRDVKAASRIPVIMLTSSESEFDEVMALGLGADDYVTKPYKPATLLARIQSILRRNAGQAHPRIGHAGLILDASTGMVSYGSRSTELSRNEQRILQLLIRNAGNVVSRQQIMAELWDSDEFIDDNTLTVNVNRLRRALESIGAPAEYIKTKRGMGYRV